MNELFLVRKNLFRKPVRTVLLLVSILIAFLIYAFMTSLVTSMSDFNTKPTRLITLSKINFTETLPIAHYDKISRMEGVAVATHMNWFGGYYQDPVKGFMPVFAVDPETYFEVYKEDLPLSEEVKAAFFKERTAMLAAEPVARRWGWKVGQKVPLNSNIFTQADGSRVWDFTLVGTIPTPPGSSQTGSVLIHYDYFNETIDIGRDRIGWIPFLSTSAEANDKVIAAIDQRFANSADETRTNDEATFNKSFAAQLGNLALVLALVVGAAFIAILLIVGTTMTLAIRERTKEFGVMKTLGFSSGSILRMVLGESLLLAFLGAALGVLLAVGLLAAAGSMPGAPPLHLATPVLWQSALMAAGLGLVTGVLPALAAYRLSIVDALSRK
ncbi:MAG: ABC transporter permease [Parvularculaceae bacterium]|nr:ABC transporter permease [Parvularculaceae bacterium]